MAREMISGIKFNPHQGASVDIKREEEEGTTTVELPRMETINIKRVMRIIIGQSIFFCCRPLYHEYVDRGSVEVANEHMFIRGIDVPTEHCPFCGAEIIVVDPEENAKKIFRDAAGDPKDECIGGHVSNQDYSDTEPQRTFIVDEDDGYAD